jgi:hypothetical protein
MGLAVGVGFLSPFCNALRNFRVLLFLCRPAVARRAHAPLAAAAVGLGGRWRRLCHPLLAYHGHSCRLWVPGTMSHTSDRHCSTAKQVGGNVLAACRLPAVTGVPTAGPFGSYYCGN